MAKKNPHIGSSFESWLDEAGIREEVTASAIKAVIARQSKAFNVLRGSLAANCGYNWCNGANRRRPHYKGDDARTRL
jgi:hypothetical protein